MFIRIILPTVEMEISDLGFDIIWTNQKYFVVDKVHFFKRHINACWLHSRMIASKQESGIRCGLCIT